MRFQVQQFSALYQLALDAGARGKYTSVRWFARHDNDVLLDAEDRTTEIKFNGDGFDVFRDGDADASNSNITHAQALDVIMASAVYATLVAPKSEPEVTRPAKANLSRGRKAWETRRATGNAPQPGIPQSGTKAELIINMLLHENGATGDEIKAATGWPSIGVRAYASRYGVRLTTSTDRDGVTRYHGTRAEQAPIRIVENG